MDKLRMLLWNIKESLKLSNYKRDKSIVLFGAWFGNRFADNPRYLYQYLSDNKEQLGLTHVVWVTRNEFVQKEILKLGYECYLMNTAESVYFHKKAGFHFLCNESNDNLLASESDLLCRYSWGAIKINLWHGTVGIKGLGFTSNEFRKLEFEHRILAKIKKFEHTAAFPRKYLCSLGGWGDQFFITTTDYLRLEDQKFNLLKDNRFIYSGFPRNCENKRLTNAEEKIVDILPPKGLRILYAPTFRESGNGYFPPLESEQFISWLRDNPNIIWIEKRHSVDVLQAEANSFGSNIVKVDSGFDISILIEYSDIIITDYSSVSHDALYHMIPVIYYVPDLEGYATSDRGFMQKPEEFMIGPKAENIDKLIKLIETGIDNLERLYSANYKDAWIKIWGKSKEINEIWNDILNAVN